MDLRTLLDTVSGDLVVLVIDTEYTHYLMLEKAKFLVMDIGVEDGETVDGHTVFDIQLARNLYFEESDEEILARAYDLLVLVD